LTANGKIGVFAFSERKLNPSIFVYTFPELDLKNELKGDARMDYTCMTLSDGGPYLGCCSSLPEFSITVLCTQSQAGNDVISLHFNPMNWLQLCAMGTTTVTVWKIERCGRFHILSPSLSYFLMQSSQPTRDTVTPSSLCWTATSQLNVGCSEGHLLLVDPESLSVFVLFNPADNKKKTKHFLVLQKGVVHCLEFRQRKIHITQTWKLERPISTAVLSPDDKTLLLSSKTATTLACCPIANYAAVGTASGKVQFIDLNDEKQLCLVHEVYLYHTAVDHLVQVSSIYTRA
uniref:Cilia- and flagella-associated protein 43 n=1 Tax=Cyprinodon variegatus TaxID=28743 RepID=A0A3Q2DY37_CYPVA